MIKIAEIVLPLDTGEEQLKKLAAEKLKIKPDRIQSLKLIKKSVDARKKNDVRFICSVAVSLLPKEESQCLNRNRNPKITRLAPQKYQLPLGASLPQRPVIVGFGPAGMFAALILAQAGQRPVVLERGSKVEERAQSVQAFWRGGALDPEANVQFGEGGAGTFSDGKLNTGIKDFRCRKVLEELVAAGAPEEILWEAKPHIGTDRLPIAVRNIRKAICNLGGEIHFHTKMTALSIRDGKVKSVLAEKNGSPCQFDTETVILAVGHSARDTFEWLYQNHIAMEQKPFSVGARIEHLQSRINAAQYGPFAGHPALGAADYKLSVHLPEGRGVYTFCMCPGGTVVAAASETGGVVTNGMSNFARDGSNANAALLVGVNEQDFQSTHPLAGIYYQRALERAAFLAGGENYCAPVQRVEDFLAGRVTTQFGEVLPSYHPGTTLSDLSAILPESITQAMRAGLRVLDQRLKGFASPDALLTGVETRSSSPVRILRDQTGLQSVSVSGLYPCGEGAGYAGGIMSAAVDGIRCAEQVCRAGSR